MIIDRMLCVSIRKSTPYDFLDKAKSHYLVNCKRFNEYDAVAIGILYNLYFRFCRKRDTEINVPVSRKENTEYTPLLSD